MQSILVVLSIGILVVGAATLSAQETAGDAQLGACAIGGGMLLSSRAEATFALSQERDSLHVDGIIIARGRPGWRGLDASRRSLVAPKLSGSTGPLTGGTIDTLFMRFDTKAHIAWVHTLRVPLDSNNVVLVDRADTQGGPPIVVGLERIPSAIPLRGSCADKEFVGEMSAALEKVLKSVPVIAAFIGR